MDIITDLGIGGDDNMLGKRWFLYNAPNYKGNFDRVRDGIRKCINAKVVKFWILFRTRLESAWWKLWIESYRWNTERVFGGDKVGGDGVLRGSNKFKCNFDWVRCGTGKSINTKVVRNWVIFLNRPKSAWLVLYIESYGQNTEGVYLWKHRSYCVFNDFNLCFDGFKVMCRKNITKEGYRELIHLLNKKKNKFISCMSRKLWPFYWDLLYWDLLI